MIIWYGGLLFGTTLYITPHILNGVCC